MSPSIVLAPFPRTLILITTLVCLILFFSFRSPSYYARSSPIITMSSSPSTSPLAHWYSRTQPHPSPDTFIPTHSALSFVVLHSAQAAPEGFTLAFFEPDVAVDARGRVLQVTQSSDFDGLSQLAKRTLDDTVIPETGGFLNTWRIKQRRTEQPFEQLYVPRSPGSKEMKVTSVQGYDGRQRVLDEGADGFLELPDLLWVLFALVLEARSEYARGQEDMQMIRRVRSLLQHKSSR